MLKYMFLWDGALFSTLVWKIDESWLLPQDRNENLRYRQKHEFLERIVKKGLSAP
jgi:hypothetical protein